MQKKTQATLAAAQRTWTIDGVERQALVFAPESAKTKSAPLVFVFHGHGGTADRMAVRYRYQVTWPEAIVVYPQGLNTPGRLTDPEGKKPGWVMQLDAGNRDLRFFDAMVARLRADYKVDDSRIYVTGHSNGGGFTYLLWAVRGDLFAAVAPTAAGGGSLSSPDMPLKPKPALHLAGEKDALVKFEWQQRTMETIRRINRCGKGKPWDAPYCTFYPSQLGTPVVTYIHPGAHGFPVEAAPVIQKFFQMHAKPAQPSLP